VNNNNFFIFIVYFLNYIKIFLTHFIRENVEGKRATEITLVNVLVHVLKTTPALCQDPSCYSSYYPKAELDGGVVTTPDFFMSRK